MIKRANNKKKKGFTLIELIIVLAVMAIIALIAIPNFAAVRNNSKVKADKQSCATIERTVLMLVSDETISLKDSTKPGTIEMTFPGASLTLTDVAEKEADTVKKALAEVKEPQEKDKTKYIITIDTEGSVKAVTGPVKEVEEGK
ncbi:type II secretion system protein [Clostridium sp. UBA3061]|uniref:type II secretion system protein n=1 Tax=Clostridium sp. UBA3061 TaxID=1946353 RepID=UPI003216D4FF|nr:type II secretion system protein [Escherichia coli]